MALDPVKNCDLCGENVNGFGHRATCPDAPREAPPEYGHCSRCRMGTGFVWDAVEEDFVSECCAAYAVERSVI